MKRTNGIDFSDEVLEQIRSLVREEPSISRVQLSRRVCEWLGLVNSTTGKLKEVSCRKALCELDRQQIICLPPVSKQFSFQSPRPVAPPAITPLNLALKELGPLELVRVAKGELSAVWRGMLDAYHYLKSGPLCGHQIRYLVRSPVYGWVAALSFSACSPSVENRDGWIGWNKAAKTANRHLLVNNSRFLIPPMVKVKGLASHVLALAAARLSSDWKALYGYEPAMLETYVECGRFRGSCYAGAGWKHVGTTKGIGRNRERVAPKEVYLNPLKDDWRHLLCSVNGQTEVISPKVLNEDPKDWIEEEFGHAQLGDSRLTARLLQITGQFFQNPMSSISHACGSFAAATLAYRFLDNERVDWQAILRSHFEATADRIREHPLVLVAQDTTTLNYSALTKTVGLGPICENEHVRGLVVHDTLSFTPAGTPLGLLDVQVWTRPEPDGQKHPESYKSKPIEQKESFKWLASFQKVSTVQKRCGQTQIVLIADREADIYEYFVEHMKTRHPADLLVRANHNTQRKAQLEIEQEPGQQKEDPRIALLWTLLEEETESCPVDFFVPPGKDRQGRHTRLGIRFAKVKLQPPRRKKDLPEIEIWVVRASEINPPENGDQPIDWVLFTTVPTEQLEQARERVEWYAKRWGIEVYHRVLKSGCQIEKRQLGHVTRLKNCLAIYMVIAWRIFLLTMQGREAPEIPCWIYFTNEEWKALVTFLTKRSVSTQQPPTLNQAVNMLARLGGYLARNSDAPPGSEVLWRGLARLADISRAYKLYAISKIS